DTISFEDGWSKFITDNDPMHGDFLLFSYDGYRTFLPKAPVNIQEISDEDETAGDDDDDDDYEEDNDQNMIISLSSGSSDEENVDTTVGEAHGSSRRVTSSQRKRAEAIGDPGMYLGDPSKPFFIATSTCSGSVLQVIKDHDLKFGGTIKFIDGFGELEGKIGNWKYSIVVNKWKEIYERNDATPEYYLNLVFLRSWICSCVHLNLLTVLDLKLCSFKSSEGLGFAVVFI
ncbi:unnamed protein product, partial [Brassica rapa]